MKKIKVLHIVPSFGVGGAEKLVLDYLTYFDSDKVTIKAISMSSNQNTIYDKFIEENGLNVEYLDKNPGLDLSMLIKIKKVIKDYNPDVIHTHMHSMKYLLYSIIRGKRVKLFHTIHNEPEKDAGTVDKVFNKIAFKYFKCTPIALTKDLAEKVKEFYDISKVEVVNNGINLENFKKITKSKIDIRYMLNLPANAFVIGHVGRFSKQKNHDFIIDIFKEFVNVEKNCYLILVGDGELKNIVEEKVEHLGLRERVKFLGLRKDIPDMIKCMDVFLFPSLHEGFPITLVEAQASGIRCVISNEIDERAILSENTVSLGLDDAVDKWCEVIRDTTIKSEQHGNLKDYDILNIVEILEGKYRNSIIS